MSGSELVRGLSEFFSSDQQHFLVLPSAVACINRRQLECMEPMSAKSFELYVGVHEIRSVAEHWQNSIEHVEEILIIG